MSLKNFDLKNLNELELDINDMGNWPKPAKVFVAFLLAIVVAILSYQLMISDQIENYKTITEQENELKLEYRAKYHIAINADAYKTQMRQMEQSFAELLKTLPTETETPGLLDDITYIGTTNGLTFTKINWEPEIEREFYTELPLKLEITGSYHDFGHFLSKVAALPRIVTLHDFTIKQKDGNLILSLLAKTYRYKEVKTND
ncbi:type 4a pilus biogenesis protein PilO [Catenovulum sp. 2E275]|uniref:type 4a pilus biogenesis protein PilO n=1 Tax=Catenovulum sp. 2E275 TaxID=2980497 RepID=UPI0021CEA7D6|nr:type 4a pilus biogenesis protein PilO [Catenovulum sp. 2E275]MCU4675833.1 type 4a pilus biogenesis protein PilO [Catenovulum sp. 2E275]